MKEFFKLMRVKHYIKNFLIFVPLFFGEEIFVLQKVKSALLGTIGFCFISSAVYIVNDLKDVEKDRRHPTKKERPIASGRVGKREAIGIFIICVILAILMTVLTGQDNGLLYLFIYLVINILYSCGLKNQPIVDIVILASGYVIRIFYGALLTETVVSGWLYLVVVTGAIYMGLGKRRNEMRRESDTREVLKRYTYPFLDKNMYVCVALVNVFYSLWAMESADKKMLYTVPIFMICLMKYSLDIEGDSDGDPVEVILSDKGLIMLVSIYAVCIFCLLYVC